MGRNLQSGERLRPVDLAREHGLSTQAVRNYEEAGILPAAQRTPHGYRTYTPRHAQALRTFLALAPGHGHRTATEIMRAATRGAVDEALRLIDESHTRLLDDRRTLQAVEAALRDLEPTAEGRGGGADHAGTDHARVPHAGAVEAGVADAEVARPGDMFIGPLADQLGIRPATLRVWERAGLVHPRRDPKTGYRVYDPAAVRDARLTHQLRRGGYLLERIAPLIAQVRTAGGLEPLKATLGDWHARLSARGRAMLAGAAQLDRYLGQGTVGQKALGGEALGGNPLSSTQNK
ncbi:TioE family transcriptional regulator [Streptomyces sp. NPDC056361]|uniref:TioE family transcriptional regulator n=1 Tax=Streptomyces sp. NPDC056361 TaxID=3345795 RepID=UPI0035DC403E